MAGDRDLARADVPHEAREIVDIFGQRVAAAPGPVGIAVPAQVRGEHVKMRLQRARDRVEAAAMIAPAVNQQQRRRALVAPVRIMQPQAVRGEEAAVGQGHGRVLRCW